MKGPPVPPAMFPAMLDAARQQAELVCYVASKLEEHEARLDMMERRPPRTAPESSDGLSAANTAAVWQGRSWRRASAMLEVPRSSTLNPRLAIPGTPVRCRSAGEPSKESLEEPGEEPGKESGRESDMEQGKESLVGLTELSPVSQSAAADQGDDKSCVSSVSGSPIESVLIPEAPETDDLEQKFEDFSQFIQEEFCRFQEVQQQAIDDVVERKVKAVMAVIQQKLDGRVARLEKSTQRTLDKGLASHASSVPAVPVSAPRERLLTPDCPSTGKRSSSPRNPAVDAYPVPDLVQGATIVSDVIAVEVPLPITRVIHEIPEIHFARGEAQSDVTLLLNQIESLTNRLPIIEEALADVKPLRLQVPALQNEFQDLQKHILSVGGMGPFVGRSSRSPSEDSDFGDVVNTEAETEELGLEQGVTLAAAHAQKQKGFRNVLSSYLAQGKGEVCGTLDAALMEKMERQSVKVDKLERDIKNIAMVPDLEQLVVVLQDRLKELDEEYRVHAKKVDLALDAIRIREDAERKEDRLVSKAWNMENQVDVIQSVVEGEMRIVRQDMESLMRTMLKCDSIGTQVERPEARQRNVSVPRSSSPTLLPRSRSCSPGPGLADLDEKVKRLQDCYQQCTLKISALKASSRHVEQQTATGLELVYKVKDELEQVAEQSTRNECRIDYLSLDKRSAGSSVPSTTFASVVGVSELPRRQLTDPAPRASIAKSRRASATVVSSVGPAEEFREGDDFNTSRIWRLSKKVSELDGETSLKLKSVTEDLFILSQKVGMFSSFLPRKQRRIVERLGTVKDSEAGEPETEREMKKSDGRRRVSFSESKPQIQVYTADEDVQVPWQMAGEPEQRWAWCYQSHNEMARDLAHHLEQTDHERLEFEEDTKLMLERLREEVAQLTCRRSDFSPEVGVGASPENERGRKLDKTIMPQLFSLDERVERLASDLRDLKRSQESDHARKVDREEHQLVAMRLAAFEKFEPNQVTSQIEVLENMSKTHQHALDLMNTQLRQAAQAAAPKADLFRLKGEVSGLRNDFGKMQSEFKDVNLVVSNSNRHVTSLVVEIRSNCEKSVKRLDTEKVGLQDLTEVSEKVAKLESGLRDNRQILAGSGGQEVNSLVKRLILNMEDKIMTIERRFDCLEGIKEHKFVPDDAPLQPTLEDLKGELSGVANDLEDLKDEVGHRKAEMEQIQKEVCDLDAVQRLSVNLEGEDTPLSLSRVQVMIQTAARHLIAGNKWITKETFECTVEELRREWSSRERPVGVTSFKLAALPDKLGSVKTPRREDGTERAGLRVMQSGIPPGPCTARPVSRPPCSARKCVPV